MWRYAVQALARLPRQSLERALGLRKVPDADPEDGSLKHVANPAQGDLAPTVLDILDLPLPYPMDGRSLLPELQDRAAAAPRVVFLERRDYLPLTRLESSTTWGLGKEFAIRSGEWKLIHKALEESELYNLHTDPWELRNRISDEPVVAGALRGQLIEWLEQRSRSSDPPTSGLDDRTVDQLKALGYL